MRFVSRDNVVEEITGILYHDLVTDHKYFEYEAIAEKILDLVLESLDEIDDLEHASKYVSILGSNES